MKEYRVINEINPVAFENALNKAVQEGFELECFKPVGTGGGGMFHIALMVKDEEVQEQKEKVKNFLGSYQNLLEKAFNDELTDEDLEELNDETFEFLKGTGRVR